MTRPAASPTPPPPPPEPRPATPPDQPRAEALIEARGLSFAYPAHQPTLQGLNLRLVPGERLGLIGGNGSGKSTLLQLLVGLMRPTAGELLILGRPRRVEADFREVRRRVGLVFQNADDQLFCPTVLDDVAFGPLNLGKTPEEARSIALAALERVGLAGFEERITYKLSGGEKRGVAIATVLAMEPEVLLLDEPTTGLDQPATERLSEVLLSLPQAMILVSHDHGLVHNLATRCVRLAGGVLHPLHADEPHEGLAAC